MHWCCCCWNWWRVFFKDESKSRWRMFSVTEWRGRLSLWSSSSLIQYPRETIDRYLWSINGHSWRQDRCSLLRQYISQSLKPTSNSFSSISPYWWNRGLDILSTTKTKQSTVVFVFCPPHYSGDKCQFHQDWSSSPPFYLCSLEILRHLRADEDLFDWSTNSLSELLREIVFQFDFFLFGNDLCLIYLRISLREEHRLPFIHSLYQQSFRCQWKFIQSSWEMDIEWLSSSRFVDVQCSSDSLSQLTIRDISITQMTTNPGMLFSLHSL